MHHRNNVKHISHCSITVNYYVRINQFLQEAGSMLRGQNLYLLTCRAERMLEQATVPMEHRDGCTLDFTEAAIYPGQRVTRLVLRRMALRGSSPIWRCVYLGTHEAEHMAEETGVLRLTLAAEEARIRRNRATDKNLYRFKGKAVAETPERGGKRAAATGPAEPAKLRLVDAA